jgi:hypothetical protein
MDEYNLADLLMRSTGFIVEQSMSLALDRHRPEGELNNHITIRPVDPNDPVWTDRLGGRIGSVSLLGYEMGACFRAYAEMLEATAPQAVRDEADRSMREQGYVEQADGTWRLEPDHDTAKHTEGEQQL